MRELLLVIGRPADIRVAGTGRGQRGISLERQAIKAVFEHGLDVAIGAGAHGDGARAGRFHSLGAVLLRQTEQAKTGPIPLLGVRPAREDLLDCRFRPIVNADSGRT
jgi:hypothetical protein